MKRNKIASKILSIALALMPCAAMADAVQYLVVTEKSGQETTFALEEKPIITLNEGMMKVESTAASVEFAIDDVAKYTFVESTNDDAISATSLNHAAEMMLLDAQTVGFSNLEAGSMVVVATIGGKQVASVKASDSGLAKVSFSQMPGGVYVIKTSGASYKLNIKK